MPTTPPPTTHHLVIHTPAGDSRRYAVDGVQKLQDGIATVTVHAGEWLDLGTYAATYEAGDGRVAGSYAVYDRRSSGEAVQFVGIFMREGSRWETGTGGG